MTSCPSNGDKSPRMERRLAAIAFVDIVGYSILMGRDETRTHQRWMAAVLACGAGAVLSHRSAGALWRIVTERGRPGATTADGVDVIVDRRSEHRRPGIRARSRRSLPTLDHTVHRGIPVTTPARTLLDLATELTTTGLERAVNEADKRDLIDPEALRAALGGFAGDHVERFDGLNTLRPGIYLVRVTQGADVRVARAALVH